MQRFFQKLIPLFAFGFILFSGQASAFVYQLSGDIVDASSGSDMSVSNFSIQLTTSVAVGSDPLGVSVDSISGFYFGEMITGLNIGYESPENKLFVDYPLSLFNLRTGGISFETNSLLINVYNFDPDRYSVLDAHINDINLGNRYDLINIQATAVPEPATYALLFIGLALLGFTVRRKI